MMFCFIPRSETQPRRSLMRVIPIAVAAPGSCIALEFYLVNTPEKASRDSVTYSSQISSRPLGAGLVYLQAIPISPAASALSANNCLTARSDVFPPHKDYSTGVREDGLDGPFQPFGASWYIGGLPSGVPVTQSGEIDSAKAIRFDLQLSIPEDNPLSGRIMWDIRAASVVSSEIKGSAVYDAAVLGTSVYEGPCIGPLSSTGFTTSVLLDGFLLDRNMQKDYAAAGFHLTRG